MFIEMLQGFASVFEPSTFLIMCLGVVLGLLIGILPGIGGLVGLAVLIPFTFDMTAAKAFAFLLGMHSVVFTGGGITSILFNTPGEGPSAATILDGYPMTQKGQAGRALGNALTASALGGLFGAFSMAILIPLIRPLVMAFATPEFFMMGLVGLSVISLVAGKSMSKGLISAGLGLLLAMIGTDPMSGIIRFNFGTIYLYEGIPMIVLTIGLFAVAEMIDLQLSGGAISKKQLEMGSNTGVWQGIKDVFQHWWLVIRSSAIGTIIGAIPGVGANVAVFIAYGSAKRASKHPELFGTGIPEGVIAPESADNAKEGGSLVPTLAFGIPGSSAMAIVLGALIIHGLNPGPEILTNNMDLVFSMVATLIIANVVGAVLCLGSANYMARISNVRNTIIVPMVMVFVSIGAFAVKNSMTDVWVAFLIGILGYVMKVYDYPRPPLIIAFVLGRIVETNLLLSLQIHGPFFFLTRPISLILILLLIVFLFPRFRKGRPDEEILE